MRSRQMISLLIVSVLAPGLAVGQTASPAARVGVVKASPTPSATLNTVVLPIRRVVLYSTGLAFVERRGTVFGNAEIQLNFRDSDLDDVLKSLLVLDSGQGRIGEVSFNIVQPSSVRLSEIPFTAAPGTRPGDDAQGLAGILRQLQGAKVVVTIGGQEFTGAVITLARQEVKDKDNRSTSRDYLVLAGEDGTLRQLDLEEVRSVRLLDNSAREAVTRFAETVNDARRQTTRTLAITARGSGERELTVAYTVAAPVWKTTYRVVWDGSGKPLLQGWAIVDNPTEEDWSGVELSLVSGAPASSVRALGRPLYAYRPVENAPAGVSPIPQSVCLAARDRMLNQLSIAPHAESVSVPVADKVQLPENKNGTAIVLPGMTTGGEMAHPSINGLSGLENSIVVVRGMGRESAAPQTRLSNAIAAGNTGLSASATGIEAGDLFSYRVEQPVNLVRQRSALIPIVQCGLMGERISLYPGKDLSNRPASGIRLQNTTDLTLESGPVTLFEGDAFGGDGVLPRTKPGEKKIIPFGTDLDMTVSSTEKTEREPAFLVKAEEGHFQAHFYEVKKIVYTVKNQDKRGRTLYIEHPIDPEWDIPSNGLQPVNRDNTRALFRLEVGAAENRDFTITLRCPKMDEYDIEDLAAFDVDFFASRGYLDVEAQASLRKIVEIKEKIQRVEERLSLLETEKEAIDEEQERLRNNIEAFAKKSSEANPLISRYLAKANQQETRLEQIAGESKATRDEKQQLIEAHREACRGLVLKRNLTPDRTVR